MELAEAKLRALGVSFGDDEPIISPAVSNMSRQTSMQYPPLPFSPPIPSASAASSHMSQGNPFSPHMMPGISTSQSSNPGSIASPASMHAQMHGKFNPRQSVSFSNGEHPFGSPFQYPQQPSPGVWSPQQLLYQQGTARGGSPAIQNLGAMASPSSPFSPEGYFQQGDVLAQLHHRQQSLQIQLQHQQQLQLQTGARASPRLQEVRESPDEEVVSKSPSKTPEARQIRHNPSASLQKEIDDAEYHLEEQFERQLEHDDYSPHSDKDENQFKNNIPAHVRKPSSVHQQALGHVASQFAGKKGDGPVLQHPQPHSRGHSLSQQPFPDNEESSAEQKLARLATESAKIEGSDFETNPSNAGTPVINGHGRSLSIISNPWQDSDESRTEKPAPKRPGHSAKPSMSTLNVAAKEFKFNPATAYSPSQFTFGGSSFQPPPITTYSSFAPPQSAISNHISHPSVSRINVAAPVFTPGNSEFNFSSSGPSFRPDAPVFTPSFDNKFSESVGSTGSIGEDLRTSIFGNIDLSNVGISKTPKKNKAVPIIRPDSSHSPNVEEEEMFDEEGRIVRSEGRIKRAKGGKDDGDSIPLFAEPTMPLGETSREQSPPKENLPSLTTQNDKENAAPAAESGDEAGPPVPVKDSVQPEVSPVSHSKEFAPWEFKQQEHAAEFNAARPFTASRYGSAYGNREVSDEEVEFVESERSDSKKSHKKNSLSATAKPFEFKPGAFSFKFGEPASPVTIEPAISKGLSGSKYARDSSPEISIEPVKPVAPVNFGLSGSRYARSPTPEDSTPFSPPFSAGISGSRYARSPTPEQERESPVHELDPEEYHQFQTAVPQPQSPPRYDHKERSPTPDHENLPLEDIDAIMNEMNAHDHQNAPRNGSVDTFEYRQPSPAGRIQVPDDSSPIRLQPQNLMRSDAPSPSPGRFNSLAEEPAQEERSFSRGMEHDPFGGEVHDLRAYGSPVRLNNGSSIPASDWDDVLSETEESKFQHRAQFFDSHVNELVGGLLEDRLNPLEKTLEAIQLSVNLMASRAPSSRRGIRSVSGALSDADDEDDDEILPRRSHSPRRDKKLEKIRSIITEALNTHHSSRPQTASSSTVAADPREVLQALAEMREQFGQSMRLDFRAEDLRNIVEEAVEKRMPPSPEPVVDEAAIIRDAEQKARIEDLELRLARAQSITEEETKNRRAAEDRLSEVQRLLRISAEEEDRLRDAMEKREINIQNIVDERDQKVRSVEEQRHKTTMRIALLEAAQENSSKSVSDAQSRLSHTEKDLRDTRQQLHHWQMEAERAMDAARRHSEDVDHTNEMNKELRRKLDSVKNQMEESIRVREAMRGKLIGLQEDMASAARNITDENARRFKKEQELIARQEVLDARLQAEARTRERLEQEIERLETGERDGMRAVSESKRLEALVIELRNENHLVEKDAMRYQREFEEARESGLSEVQRTRNYLQAEVEAANNQVNVVREDLENQITLLRNQLDQVKLDADAALERNEMLLEESQVSRQALIDDLKRKHADYVEDIQTGHERQLGNSVEDAQRTEQHLLERLSLSSAKTEHLQDRVAHLEEKLDIANQAATAAAQAAQTARSNSIASSQQPRRLSRAIDLPEKVSPQALRESIMVLQEQLQDREQTIEQLEVTITELDPDSATKISKRDDEIIWLRELLSVRQSDLTDIVEALETDQWDGDRVKDAAIRLRANLQMEEQEHERAMNGGSALNLPNIAASIRDAASPRVAQAVGPLAAAWGNWRKGRENSNISEVVTGTRSNSSTPSRTATASPSRSFLSGLLTPPTGSARTPGGNALPSSSLLRKESQPTAFGSTGQRFTREQLANRPAVPAPRVMTPRRQAKSAAPVVPSTPPMMRQSAYDADATAGDFSDAGFYDDDESTVDDYRGESVGGR